MGKVIGFIIVLVFLGIIGLSCADTGSSTNYDSNHDGKMSGNESQKQLKDMSKYLKH